MNTPPKVDRNSPTPDEVKVSYQRTLNTAKVRPEGYLASIFIGAVLSQDGNWLLIKRSDYIQHVSKFSPQGLGDKVAAVAKPIARGIDRAAAVIGIKTNVANCGGCAKRQDALNTAAPSFQTTEK
jgi:hypothetical protein